MRLKAIEKDEFYTSMDVKDFSLVPDLVLPPKFKMPEFKKYKGTTSLQAHIKMFIQKMVGYSQNDQLLIHCFQESLSRLTL